MYRQFKSGGQKNEQPQQASECSSPKEQNSDPPSDPEAERQVAACWDVIWHTCSQTPDGADGIPGLGHLQRRSADSQTQALGGWQTVRIFVSSTFVDFFSEREILVKKVFPELREWCQERKLKLVECDLRWGVPKDATSTQALLTCLEEIDRCYETNSQPFFLNMLGERYGWIPGKGEVPEEVREKYTWVEGTSMTFMEILHGVLRISNPNAAFFLRDSGFTSSIPESHISRFQSETSLARVHMKELKSQLANKFPRQMFSYSANYAGISEATGREQVNLDGLEDFADQVKVFFQAAIEKAYPFSSKADDIAPEQRETQLQWMFIQDKAETLIGRNNDLQLLQKYANGESDLPLEMIEGKNATIRKLEDWDVEEGVSRLCLVTAEGGWGKTALLAALAQQAIQDGREVFYHFVGSTASSVFHINLVQRLLLALCLDPADPEVRDPEADLQTKMKVLRRLLSVWRAGNRKMLIVIDGVNELDNSESLYHLSWLPPWLPPAVRCVVSSNASHLPTKARLFEHPAYHLALSALDSAALQSLAASFFGNYGKKLESTQLQHLVETTRVDNPLWMTLMCEELRVFGDFRMMDKKLAALPDKMDTFLTSVIHRLLSEDETSCVKKVLFLTACSTTGLPTNSMLKLLGDMDRKAECPPLHWAQARRVLKAYSRTVRASGDREEYYSFVHQAMWKAVRQCMQEREEDPKAWHKQLADFYQYSCDNFILRINYLPFQLQQARLHKRLVEFIRHDRDAARMPAFQRSRLLKEQRCMNPSDAVVPNTREVVMCGMCANRQGGFNPGVYFPNKDVCYLCSNLTFSHSRQPARICFVHAMKNRLGPRNSACCVCGRMVVLGLKNMPLPPGVVAASLCQLCGFGIQGKQCCHMKDLPD